MELLAEYTEYPVETGLLSKQLDEASRPRAKKNNLSMNAKSLQLFKRRRQRQARKHLRVKSLRRSMKVMGRGVNRRKAALYKARRKRNRTRRLFRRRKR